MDSVKPIGSIRRLWARLWGRFSGPLARPPAKRSWALGALSALGLWSCDPIVTYRADPPKPKIRILTLTGLKTDADTLEAGTEYPVHGVLRTDTVFGTVEYSLWSGDDTVTGGHEVRILSRGLTPGQAEWDLRTSGDVRIVTGSAAREGGYILKIKAVAGDSSITFPLPFHLIRRFEPGTAATVVGIWRATVPAPAMVPPAEIEITVQIDPGGTLVVTRRMVTGQSSPKVFVQILREFSEWDVEAGEFRAQKTACAYHDPVTQESGTDCRAPLEWKSEIVVSRGVWTFVENGDTTLLVRD